MTANRPIDDTVNEIIKRADVMANNCELDTKKLFINSTSKFSSI